MTSPTAPVPKGLILAIATLACFMVILDATIVNVAIESIRESLGATLSGLQWVVDGYGLTFAAFLLSAGALADRLGPRRAFAGGLALFSLASLACGLAPNLNLLVVARAVQGIGAALLIPTSLALISHTFTERSERAQALAIWGGIGSGTSSAFKPLGTASDVTKPATAAPWENPPSTILVFGQLAAVDWIRFAASRMPRTAVGKSVLAG